MVSRGFYEVKVSEIMQKKNLPLVEKSTSIVDVLPFPMSRSHVWVIESKRNKKVVGVITEHDILSILSARVGTHMFGLPNMRSLHEGTAEDVMVKRVVKCGPDETIEDALNKMRKEGIRRLPVTKKNDILIGEVHLKHITDKFSEIIKKRR